MCTFFYTCKHMNIFFVVVKVFRSFVCLVVFSSSKRCCSYTCIVQLEITLSIVFTLHLLRQCLPKSTNMKWEFYMDQMFLHFAWQRTHARNPSQCSDAKNKFNYSFDIVSLNVYLEQIELFANTALADAMLRNVFAIIPSTKLGVYFSLIIVKLFVGSLNWTFK